MDERTKTIDSIVRNKAGGEQWAWAAVAAAYDAGVAAERLLSMPRLMHGCDALGAPADGAHCELLRQALAGA